MRKREKSGGLSVHAIAGTHVVLLGLDMDVANTKELLGFAFHRTDHKEEEQYWLKGFKTFEEIEPYPCAGHLYSTNIHPAQTFLWADYTAKPDHKYTYKVVSLYGLSNKIPKNKPKNLVEGDIVEVDIKTESETTGIHSVFFNRGVTASQAYTRKFGNNHPKDIKDREAYIWLSRGLEENMIAFINRKNESNYGLRAAVYEFNWIPVIKAFVEADSRGADVKIIYDAKKPDHTKLSEDAMKAAGIDGSTVETIRRETHTSYIAHNKFIVYLENNNEPTEVWTGSANFTESGIFGQSNVGHIVRDKAIASKYLEYWNQLQGDPTRKILKEWTEKHTKVPANIPANSITPIFSPRASFEALEKYANLMDNAKQTVCLTIAFTLSDPFKEVFSHDKDYLRYILHEKRFKNIHLYKLDTDIIAAMGSNLDYEIEFKQGYNIVHKFLEEEPKLGFHVRYIHTKYMLIDPLTDDPVIITGSANFSNSSTKSNDENMLIIKGNKNLADIYLGEFMRLFNHYYFRSFVNRFKRLDDEKIRKSVYLKNTDDWCKKYFKEGERKFKQRILFK